MGRLGPFLVLGAAAAFLVLSVARTASFRLIAAGLVVAVALGLLVVLLRRIPGGLERLAVALLAAGVVGVWVQLTYVGLESKCDATPCTDPATVSILVAALLITIFGATLWGWQVQLVRTRKPDRD